MIQSRDHSFPSIFCELFSFHLLPEYLATKGLNHMFFSIHYINEYKDIVKRTRYTLQMLLWAPGLWVFGDGLNSVERSGKCPAKDRSWFSPVVSLPRASRRRSAAAGGSGTRFSRLRAAPPSACPKHASRIQRADSIGLRRSKDGSHSLDS